MEKVTVSTELDREGWDAFVSAHPEATSCHQYGWKEVVENSFGHDTHYLAALNAEKGVLGVLPLVHMKSRLFGNFLVSVPFVSYGGLLCSSQAARAALMQEAEALRAKARASHVELRHLQRPEEGLLANRGKVTMVLELAGSVEEQWSGFNAKLRNQIRKAQKNGLSFGLGGLELLDDFYGIFARNMRDLGTPVYGKRFFAEVLAAFRESTRILTVRYRGATIAAGLACWYRDTVEVPWASSIAQYKQLCPNNLLYWEAIRFSIENGFSRFDFGRSTPDEGTYNFKKQWGAEPVQLHWQYLLAEGGELPAINNKNPKYQLAIRLWKRLPVPVTRVFGPHIVRCIP